MSVWDEVKELLDRYDGAIKIVGASECAWSGQVRLTLTNPLDAPSRSMVFFSVGGRDPEDVAVRLLADVNEWLETSGVEPMGW